MKIFLDIGGTNFRFVVKSGDEIVESGSVKTESNELLGFIGSLIAKYPKTEFVGISFAGQVDGQKILSAPNITVVNQNISKEILKRHNVKCVIENDLKCAALAEYSVRKSSKMLLAIFIGTGCGSAFIYNGKIVRGAANLAGEIGHIPFKRAPFPCGCGKNDCIELFASGSALKKWTAYYGMDPKKAKLSELILNQDTNSKKIVTNFHAALSHAASTAITLLNPDTLVLGGGVALANPYLKDFLKKKVAKMAMPPAAKMCSVELSAYEDAALLGAELL